MQVQNLWYYENNNADKDAVAAYVCKKTGFHLYAISANSIPAKPDESTELIRLWNREAALKSYALFVDCSNLGSDDKLTKQAVAYFTNRLQGLLFLSTDDWAPVIKPQKLEEEVPKPNLKEQLQLWETGLGSFAGKMKNDFSTIVTQFNLSTQTTEEYNSNAKDVQFFKPYPKTKDRTDFPVLFSDSNEQMVYFKTLNLSGLNIRLNIHGPHHSQTWSKTKVCDIRPSIGKSFVVYMFKVSNIENMPEECGNHPFDTNR